MKIFDITKKIVYSTALVFTLTVFVLMGALSVFVDGENLTQTKSIPLSNYPWILLFSFITGALNNLLTAKKIPLAARLPIHFIGVMAAFYIIFLRVFGLGQSGSGRFSGMVVFCLIYAVYVLLAYVLRRAFSALAKSITAASERSKKLKEKEKSANQAQSSAEE